jgi:hypothetical protein
VDGTVDVHISVVAFAFDGMD